MAGRVFEAYFFAMMSRNSPVARYIIENPVRVGLVTSAASYPLTGSSRYSIAQIADAAQMDVERHRWRG